MRLSPRLRKLVLTAHVTTSVGWLGAVVAYLALIGAAFRSSDPEVLQASWVAMDLTIRLAIVPLALATVAIGIVNALATPWGLFRHYWVLTKLVLTVVATLVLVLHAPVVRRLGMSAVDPAATVGTSGLPGELLHAGGGLLVLLATTTLSIFKPAGLTPYGWRKKHEAR